LVTGLPEVSVGGRTVAGMSDFDWDYELSGPRSTDVRRRLTIDQRDYNVVAFDGGGGFVGLRVTGWDAGYTVTEMVGEIPAADAFDVGNLIASALAGFRESGGDPPSQDVPVMSPRDWWAAQREAAPNAGKPWETQDLELLMARFQEGASVKTLTAELGRTEGGIRSRLQLLGATRTHLAPDPNANPDPDANPAGEHLPDDGTEESVEGETEERTLGVG
jgi:hypothetical protein